MLVFLDFLVRVASFVALGTSLGNALRHNYVAGAYWLALFVIISREQSSKQDIRITIPPNVTERVNDTTQSE